MSPTINVNMGPCSLGNCYAVNPDGTPYSPETKGHGPGCPAVPVPIPCPIPRSVTFTVRLGDCSCAGDGPRDTGSDRRRVEILRHADACPDRPVRVSCSISGKTWEESKVEDAWPAEYPAGDNLDGLEWPEHLSACRARWALVKALVLGGRLFPSPVSDVVAALVHQRDAVFAALADMAQAEEQTEQTKARIVEVVPSLKAYAPRPKDISERPSAGLMSAYVERLIEQVGVLP